MRMYRRIVLGQLFLLLFVPTASATDRFGRGLTTLFKEAHAQKSDLARYDYLTRALRTSPPEQYSFVLQLYAFTENELGLYNEALRDYPLRSAPLDGLKLPGRADWEAVDAAEAIAQAATGHRLVMINEAHHDAHTRELTLLLLPLLREKGFTHFAAEALGKDEGLEKRGYPISTSGSEYIHEPLYGEMVREAIRLGYTIVPYDSTSRDIQRREEEQAGNIFRASFGKDPSARVFVHAGYAHIDKKEGRLGDVRPMGMLLGNMLGEKPLSIDQTQFREQFPNTDQQYLQLIGTFGPRKPVVLLNKKKHGEAWAAAPSQYDISVILPSERKSALGSGSLTTQVIIQDPNRPFPMTAHVVNTQRPGWMDLGGRRRPYPVRSQLCKVVIPCVVEARYANETGDAVPADRYAFVHPNSITDLYLFPGNYTISARGPEGQVLSSGRITVNP
ncbi:hypothetical protein ACFWZU_08300 [Frateuria sp. GZRR33]|uniref:hypothetical protein n=1 Tax=Frateuria sp. GZRR33 TaxID=3351535 RepID=UPI003EDB7B32